MRLRIDPPRLVDRILGEDLPGLHLRLALCDPQKARADELFGAQLAAGQSADGFGDGQLIEAGHASHHPRAMRR